MEHNGVLWEAIETELATGSHPWSPEVYNQWTRWNSWETCRSKGCVFLFFCLFPGLSASSTYLPRGPLCISQSPVPAHIRGLHRSYLCVYFTEYRMNPLKLKPCLCYLGVPVALYVECSLNIYWNDMEKPLGSVYLMEEWKERGEFSSFCVWNSSPTGWDREGKSKLTGWQHWLTLSLLPS